ncbi:hypothetical protein MGG_15698 [Pyricularia oryzae 70-15]|uniref:Uncharacterized protein n=3 Tax=Pyricularia oryzae TaxID=318829 RepID=G4MSH3_PYRO7|nr:uncharacterized protein MGG_15698 [Pyricularia oryzae 70-15]EHA54589.1 hypothetical protein MGG_15698 [Pyricularia oryzae 70-15]ELQ37553.1 hypothetical protein OOU_Y34scaffold00590g67 [Pyricularia oryzae Y34]
MIKKQKEVENSSRPNQSPESTGVGGSKKTTYREFSQGFPEPTQPQKNMCY